MTHLGVRHDLHGRLDQEVPDLRECLLHVLLEALQHVLQVQLPEEVQGSNVNVGQACALLFSPKHQYFEEHPLAYITSNVFSVSCLPKSERKDLCACLKSFFVF